MKITNTRICIDCEEVFEDKLPCPACASRTTILLARWVPPLSTITRDYEAMKMMLESVDIPFLRTHQGARIDPKKDEG